MERTASREKLLPLFLIPAIVLFDQITKAIIVSLYPKSGVFITDVFKNDLLWIIHVRNKAIAFSIGNGLPDGLRSILFVVLPALVLAGLLVYYLRTNEFSGLQRWAVAGIVGGGIGNLIDRIFRSEGVVDFISVKFYGFLGFDRWPTFNIADSSVVVCGILLFGNILLAAERRKEVGKA